MRSISHVRHGIDSGNSGEAFVSALKNYLTPQVMQTAKPSMVLCLLP